MKYKNLIEREGSEFDIEMIEDVESYIMSNYKLKGNADNAVQGIMNSTFGDMDNLEMYYNKGGAKAGAEYVMDNLPKAAIKKYLNENMHTLNEGQFSWFTQDDEQQIGSEKENTIDVWMFDEKGNSWYEDRYKGYGVFGGMDYYELVATMNGYTEDDLKVLGKRALRDVGIDLAFGKLKPADNKQKDVLFPALVSNPKRFNWKRHDFTQEAQHDPNQSWYVEPEDDQYDEDYFENKHVPSYLKFVNENLKK